MQRKSISRIIENQDAPWMRKWESLVAKASESKITENEK
jgi:hypothetical protein